MLTLSEGTVTQLHSESNGFQTMEVQVGDESRPATVDVPLLGRCEIGDRVVVNTAARDLNLGSGGYDVVHVNLTRGLNRQGLADAHVMKLNYSSMQHAVAPVEESDPGGSLLNKPVGVISLHGQLAPTVWAYNEVNPENKLGFVQSYGGALPGHFSKLVKQLRDQGRLSDFITAGHCYGSQLEAISVAGALSYGFNQLGWDAAICGPGPGILGSGSKFGHGGMTVLDNAHTAKALGCKVAVVPRASSGDPRSRHQGLSHHTATVLELLLAEVTVAWPSERVRPDQAANSSHSWIEVAVDTAGYQASGLPAKTMGRSLAEDSLFFETALAGGTVLASL